MVKVGVKLVLLLSVRIIVLSLLQYLLPFLLLSNLKIHWFECSGFLYFQNLLLVCSFLGFNEWCLSGWLKVVASSKRVHVACSGKILFLCCC